MSRLTWNAPERRFFETGLDRGVLYPKRPAPLGPVLSTNYAYNPRGINIGTGAPDQSNAEYGARWSWTRSSLNGRTDLPDELLAQGFEGFTRFTSPATDQNAVTSRGIDVYGNHDIAPVLGQMPWFLAGVHPGYGGGTHNNVFSAFVRVSVPLTLTISYRFYDGQGNWVSPGYNGKTFVTAANTWKRVYMTLTRELIPANAAYVSYRITHVGSASFPANSTWDVTALMHTWQDDIEPYFDGSTPDTGAITYEWSGLWSKKREVLTLAAPWDGLTSVEESGGESARAYYVDGRPFLFFPVPKEYKATLNAYTYPDAFAEMMGLAEVTDGMYLDSQPGQAFDLAYRTLVGNATEGQEHGYKIHLVYNATVTPGALNYETLSDSINPSTMSWEVQAVPVKVEGFRPTAHIIIDTRHMDPGKITAIESLLYGSDDTVAGMPPPQLVFDILNFGDTITVTDNGDGTFDVEGSYENVYLVGNGEFRLENIDGTINGDGTFTISTTEG